ncbi:HAMP domain-containing histidine kinase [Pontibacter sp. JH31]|uniref:histidine kinase n=1 Tax=Pontibacter aquaedesilientis TaxID=2766980 RepID=A0ABR7XBN2_9BACT|nr:HAMP domain-containing sensor histidine kinase [Pontibacter aquaedesilientis]MBD1395717.1 HAMP domain-containing histidine kinase [Pontibacter aquaedesilientis]
MRLQSKLILFSAATKVIILLVLVMVLPLLINRIALHSTDQRLLQKKEEVFDIVEQRGIDSFLPDKTDKAYGSYNLLKEEFISMEPIDPIQINNRIENTLRKVEGEIVEYRVLSLAFELHGETYLLEIGRSLDTIRETSNTLQRYALYFLFGVVILTLFLDLAFVKVLLRPLSLILRKLQKIAHPDAFKPGPIPSNTSDFVYLNDTINAMMGQVQEAFRKEKEFIGNVSHELLTPVSILQNRLENMMTDPEVPDSVLLKLVESQKTLHRLKNIIQALLLISRIENEQYLKNERVNLRDLVQEVVDEIQDRAELREVKISTSVPDHFMVPYANYSLLFTMIFNVVNNAIKYNKEGGSITISAAKQGKKLALTVSDTGTGIAKDQLPKIFTRFKRTHAPDGESHGLGLAIVQTIAKFHKVKLDVSSELGKGTRFSFVFKV